MTTINSLTSSPVPPQGSTCLRGQSQQIQYEQLKNVSDYYRKTGNLIDTAKLYI